MPEIISKWLFSRALLAIALVSTGLPAQPQSRFDNGRLFLRIFDYKEYGAHQENWSVVQDQRGLIYVGNNSGILEYDGVSWRLIRTRNETSALALDIDRDGTIYVGLENGFGFLAPDFLGQLEYVALDALLPEETKVKEVWKVHAVSNGVYFVTISEIFFWTNDSLLTIPITISGLSTIINDTLYYAQWELGIARIIDNKPKLLPGSERFARVQNYLIIPNPGEKSILVGHREEGLLTYRDGEFVPFESEVNDYLKKHQLYSALNLPDNRIALGTIRGGLIIIDQQGRLLHKIDEAYGLRDQTVVSMYYDTHGGLWLAQLDGLARVELSSPFTKFDANTGVTSAINAITEDPNTIYIGTNRGVFYLEPASAGNEKTYADFKPVSGINSFAWGFYSDGETVLAGTDKGVFEIDGKKAKHISGYPYRVRGFQASQQNQGRVYAALQTGLGVLRRENYSWQWAGKVRQVPGKEMMSLTVNDRDIIWLAEKVGNAVRVDSIQILAEPDSLFGFKASVDAFGSAHGLPEGQINVHKIGKRNVFSSQIGILKFNEEKQTLEIDCTFSRHSGRSVTLIMQDTNKKIWIIERKDNYNIIGFYEPDVEETLSWTSSPFQKLRDIGEIKSIHKQTNGELLFGGSEALVRYDASQSHQIQRDFQTHIRRITAKDSIIYVSIPQQTPVLNYNLNAIRFEYAAPFYDDAPRNQYQYYLDGFDSGWSGWTSETRKDYTNLPEGDYVFQVRARNVYSTVSPVAAFEFRILPPWYRRWWAYSLYFLLVVGFMVGVSRAQAKRQQRKAQAALQQEKERSNLKEATLRAEAAELRARAAEAEKEREKEQMRSRIAGDLHDEIGSNLSSIAMLSQLLAREKSPSGTSSARLLRIREVAEQTALSMRDIVWFVNPVNDSMEKLYSRMRETANLMLETCEFTFALEASDFETDLHFRRNLFLIYKEALQNIVRHSQAENVKIAIRLENGRFYLKISDDGRGFDPDNTPKGNGLDNFRNRAAEMGGEIRIVSQPGRGTAVDLQIEIP